MSKRLGGRVALVTGGSSGIGRATALVCAREGAKVVVASRRMEGNEKTVELIRKAGGEAIAIQTDVTREADVERMIVRTVEQYGRLDCAFNNAGVSERIRSLVECTEEEWDAVVDTNLKGVWLCMKHEARRMLAQGGGGVIVNAASVSGLVGTRGIISYTASKHGVVGLTRTAALELATANIRVNAICPAVVRGTEMIERVIEAQPEAAGALAALHPMGRVSRPEEIAEVVMWLCSDAASFITGHALPIDGGIVAG